MGIKLGSLNSDGTHRNNDSSNFNQKNNKFNKRIITVPENFVLIKQNKFTGEKIVSEQGIGLIMPWEEALELISLATDSLDIKPQRARTIEGYELTIDPVVNYSIVDPKRYLTNAVDTKKLFIVKTTDIVRKLVAMYDYDELSQIKIDLNNKEFNWIVDEYKEYEDRYGIKIDSFYIKSVELPQSLKDDFEKKQVQKSEDEARLMAAKANKNVAKIDAEREKINATVQNEILEERIDVILKLLKKNDLSNEMISKIISDAIVLENISDKENAHIFFNASQSNVDSAIAGVTISNTINEHLSDKKNNINDKDDVIDITDSYHR